MQDAHACFVVPGLREMHVTVVADGAGSASFGGQGAALACRTVASALRDHFRCRTTLPEDSEIDIWIDRARDRIFGVAMQRSIPAREFASTLIVAVSNGQESLFAQIGDGCSIVRECETGKWHVPLWPEHGEYASTTRFLIEDPTPALRVVRHAVPIDALVSFTDGLERLALDFADKTPFDRFFDGICRPLFDSQATGRDRDLSAQLSQFLDSPKINSRTDDDKTLILAVVR